MKKNINKKPVRGSLLDSYSKGEVVQMQGFFNFVNLALYFWLITNIAFNLMEGKQFPGVDILESMVSRVDLIPAWILLCCYSFLAFFLQKAIIKGLPLQLALNIHHILQIILFSLTIYWLMVSKWPIIQTCFFLAQMLCIWMKMHSYTYINRDLYLAKKAESNPDINNSSESQDSDSGNSNNKIERESQNNTNQQKEEQKNKGEQSLKQRKVKIENITNKVNKETNTNNTNNNNNNTNNTNTNSKKIRESPSLTKDGKKLVVRESPKKLKRIRTSDSGEYLVEDGLEYPNNINFRDFMYFLCLPTLVYQLGFPRTPKIRWDYFFGKVFSFLGFFFMLHLCISQYILPVLHSKTLSGVVIVIKLLIPYTGAYMIIFYLVFDIICNGIAEIMRYADREFYTDWWNSTSWDDFANRWNKPVHHWLKVHVFLELRINYATKAYKAIFITFLFSSLLHELFMAVLFKKIRPFLFVCQMSQLLLVWLGNFFNLKGTNTGNYLFWTGMMIGPPLITLIYCL